MAAYGYASGSTRRQMFDGAQVELRLIPFASTGTWKTTLALASGSTKTVLGLATASIKTFQGLTP